MSIAVDVAKAALCEVGYPELAEEVTTNRAEWPTLDPIFVDTDQARDAVVKAFWLGHKAGGHTDCYIINIQGDPGIHCDTCWALWEAEGLC